jgi:hypothetical protein
MVAREFHRSCGESPGAGLFTVNDEAMSSPEARKKKRWVNL